MNMQRIPHTFQCGCGCGGGRTAAPLRPPVLPLEHRTSLGLGSSLGAALESPDAGRDYERARPPRERGFKLAAKHKLLDGDDIDDGQLVVFS
jgi:hypothetical protein